jgi:TrmH family RNA methyltransferase
MISKNDVKYIQSLFHKKTRDEDRLFIAEGPKLVKELIESNFVMKDLFATGEWLDQNPGINGVTEITEKELQRISGLKTPNQVLAVVAKPALNDEPNERGCITLVLDGIQDPGNLGTIIRTADWFGIYQVVAGTDTADVYNPKVVQATMGSITRVKVWYKIIDEWLAKSPVPIFGALLTGADIYAYGKIEEGLLVIGNEGRGIRPEILPLIQKPLTIPSRGRAESLNAAVAAGIILSHVVG